MAVNRIHVRAPRSAVFDVLTDAPSYKIWVVGSKRIRGVDPDWPSAGSKFHHIVGWGPIRDKDTTEILEIEPPRRLVLEARVWPLGTAKVAFELFDAGDGTDVVLTEDPLRGPAARFHGRLAHWSIKLRNAIGLRRLRSWAEQRHHGVPGNPIEP